MVDRGNVKKPRPVKFCFLPIIHSFSLYVDATCSGSEPQLTINTIFHSLREEWRAGEGWGGGGSRRGRGWGRGLRKLHFVERARGLNFECWPRGLSWAKDERISSAREFFFSSLAVFHASRFKPEVNVNCRCSCSSGCVRYRAIPTIPLLISLLSIPPVSPSPSFPSCLLFLSTCPQRDWLIGWWRAWVWRHGLAGKVLPPHDWLSIR